jgi:hypothetical protein
MQRLSKKCVSLLLIALALQGTSRADPTETFGGTNGAVAYRNLVMKTIARSTWQFDGRVKHHAKGNCYAILDEHLSITLTNPGYRDWQGVSSGTLGVGDMVYEGTSDKAQSRCFNGSWPSIDWGGDVTLHVDLSELGGGGDSVHTHLTKITPKGETLEYEVNFFANFSKFQLIDQEDDTNRIFVRTH